MNNFHYDISVIPVESSRYLHLKNENRLVVLKLSKTKFKMESTSKPSRNYPKDNSLDSSSSNLLPLAVLLFFLYENRDDSLSKLAKKVIMRNGTIRATEIPIPQENQKKATSSFSKIDPKKLNLESNTEIQVFTLRRPFRLPQLREAKFEGRDLSVKLQLSNVQIVDLGPFVTKEKREIGSLNVDLEIDNVSLYVNYTFSGNIHGEIFNHQGKTDIYLADITGTVQLHHATDLTSGVLEISNLDLDFNFRSLEFGETGLNLRKLPGAELRRALNSLGKMYFKQNKKSTLKTLSTLLKNEMNNLLANKSREEIIQFLERQSNILRQPQAQP